MAFPGVYNINYYKGDTHEFKVYPKNNDGSKFDLTDYSIINFTISEQRGNDIVTDYISAYAVRVDDYILCTIRPEDGQQLDVSKTYVYDVQIEHQVSPYSKIHTLLTGTITTTEQVTPKRTIPNSPTLLVQVPNTLDDQTITVSWTLPDPGAPITGYKIYVATNPASLQQALATMQLVVTTTTPTVNTQTIAYSDLDPLTSLTPATMYGIGVYAYNDSGNSATPAANIFFTEVASS